MPKLHPQNFLCVTFVHGSDPRFSSDDIAMSYVLPVLWMSSCLHIMLRLGEANISYNVLNSQLTMAALRVKPDGYDCLVEAGVRPSICQVHSSKTVRMRAVVTIKH